ncbi:MAG: RelA/SpoT AH/RIS domain-containing protein, partial [Deltaproteobacteria bacterium]
YKLKNGDTVEVLTAPQGHPSKDWLTFVRTSRAQARIRAYIKEQEREKSLELGREVLDKELRHYGLNLNKLLRGKEIDRAAGELGTPGSDGLLAAIGYGKVSPAQVLQKLLPPDKLAERAKEGPAEAPAAGVGRIAEMLKKVTGRETKGGVKINGIDDVLVRFGRCCNPVPGDGIVGFITRGRGITVHTLSCDKVLSTDPERRVEVSWDVKGDFKRPVTVRVLTVDRPGLLAEISTTFGAKGVNISQANCRSTGDDRAVNTFEVAISDLRQLKDCLHAIERISGVFSVERV